MARIRNVKPEFFKDDEFVEKFDFAARLFYIGLWTQCDVMGRCEDKPKKLKAEIFPYDDGVDVDSLLTSFSDAQCVERYEVDGKRYLWVKKFRLHQRFGGKEIAAGSAFPPAPGDDSGSNPPTNPHPVRDEDVNGDEPGRNGNGPGRNGDAMGTHPGSQGMGGSIGKDNPPNPPSGGTQRKSRKGKISDPVADETNLADFVPLEFATDSLRKIWSEFNVHRKAKGAKPYTESGISKLWAVLKRLEYTPSMVPALVERCMAQDWKGLPIEVIEKFAKSPLELVAGGAAVTGSTAEEIQAERRRTGL